MRSSASCILLFIGWIGGLAEPSSATGSGRVVYVNARGPASSANTGENWVNAFFDLQDALDAAGPGDEIWIAAGVYKPSKRTDPEDPQAATFALGDGIALYGGFSGWENDRRQRNPKTHETILSGDHLSNDEFFPDSPDPCCTDPPEPACVNQSCLDAVCEVRPRCCRSWSEGCADLTQLYCRDLCRPTGMDNSYHVLTVIEPGAAPVLDGLIIEGGDASDPEEPRDEFPLRDWGGGLVMYNAAPIIVGCVFRHNFANAGTALSGIFSAPVIRDSVFFENGVAVLGASSAFYCWICEPVVSDTAFLRNYGGGLMTDGSQSIRRCRFEDNVYGPGLNLYGGTSTVTDCVFLNNFGDGGMVVGGGYPQISNCGFFGNYSGFDGGGLYAGGWGIVVNNCIFSGNSAGGHVFLPTFPPFPGSGGGMHHSFGTAIILNSVFVGNSAVLAGGLSTGFGTAYISNSIIWGNHSEENYGRGAQITSADWPYTDIGYTCVQDWTGDRVDAEGMMWVDPLFVDRDGPDDVPGTEDDDFHLLPDSPMINAGDPEPELLTRFDGDWHRRPLCGRVDIGAYEFGIGDYDCDGAMDLLDFSAWDGCMSGPFETLEYDRLGPGCEAFDFDADTDLDIHDFAGFQRALWEP